MKEECGMMNEKREHRTQNTEVRIKAFAVFSF
jgi:hypothetical protein